MNDQNTKKEVINKDLQTASFDEIININDLQRLQNLFANAHGVASIITDTEGVPITLPSNFTRLCENIIRKTEKGWANCFHSDSVIGRHNPAGAVVQPCLSSGLWDGGVSITVGGRHIANWLIGQVRNEQVDEEEMMKYAHEIGADKAEFQAALHEVPLMSAEQFQKIADLLFVFANELSEKAFSNWQLKKQIKENEIVNAKLLEREENLTTTLHSIGDGVISTDENGLIVHINPVAEKLTGWILSDAMGKPLSHVFKIINSETRESIDDPVKKVLQRGEIIGLAKHRVLQSKKGPEYQIAHSAAPIRDRDGAIKGVVLVFSDVTETYETQKKINANEVRFSGLLENLETAIVVHRADTSVIICNTRASELLGLSQDQMIGKMAIDPSWEFVGEENQRVLIKEYPINRIARTGKPIKKQILGINKPEKKSIIWVTVNGFPLFDDRGKIREIVISFIDITEQKQAEEALRASEAKFRQLVENSSDIIYTLKANGLFAFVSPSWARILGHEVREVEGHSFTEFVHPDDLEICNSFLQKVIETGKRAENVEYRVRHKTGVWYWHTSSASPVKDTNGKVIGFDAIARDITERKRAEEELRDIERRAALQRTAMAELVLEQVLSEIDISHALNRVMVCVSTALEVGHTSFWRLSENGSELTCLDKTDKKGDTKSIQLKTADFPGFIEVLKTESLICTEDAQNDRRTGKIPYLKSQEIVSIMATGIFIEGKLIGAVCAEHSGDMRKWHSDEEVFFSTVAGIISQIFLYEDRKKVQEALQSSESRFKEILKNVPSVAVQGYSMEGNVLYWNHASSVFYGYTEEEALGKSLLDLIIPPEIKDIVNHEMSKMKETGKPIPPSELTLMRKDGSPITVYSSHSYVNIPGKAPEFFCIDIDLTTRKKAEEQMRFLSAITENMNDSIVVTDAEGHISYINKGTQKLYGYTLNELAGKSPDLFNIDSRADEIQKELFETIARGEIYNGEALNRRKDNTEFVCEFTVAPLTDENGNISSFIGLQRDITDNRNLEKMVIRQERLSAIGELASGVAHDFNNVLQIILGGVEMALVAEEPEELKQYLESIKKSAGDAASRVRQLQRFAQKSQSQKETVSININQLSEDVIKEVKLLLNQYQEKGVHIALQSDYQARGKIEGNEGELRTCLVNLVKNSAEAMPEGGSITISTGEYKGQVYVRVADTGTGMDRETQKKIFQPFFSTKGFEPGRGLGMAQVYSTIRDHNGDVYIKKSETGKGTVMEFTLPLSHKQEVSEIKTVHVTGSARILWVDDEEMIRNLGKSMLKTLGHGADVAQSGEEALSYLAKGNHYDLVITDVGMPGMSGWQLAEQIKNRGYQTKVALLTGWGTEVSQEDRDKYNVSYVLGKPAPLQELKALISGVLEIKKVSEQD